MNSAIRTDATIEVMHQRLLATPLLALFLVGGAFPALAATATSTIPAGFAPGSIWTSKLSPVAGETVSIYTVVYNSSSAGIEGAVSFYVDGSIVGSTPFTLAAGDTSVKSVQWTAVVGAHSIGASVASAIETTTKLPASLTRATTGTTSVTVAAAIPVVTSAVPSSTASGSTTSNIATNIIAKVAATSPVAGTIANSVVQTTESIRQAGQNFLEDKSSTVPVSSHATSTATTTSKSALPNGQVLGTTTYKAPIVLGTPIAKTGLVATASRAILPLFKYPALFYPIFFFILAFIFFFFAGKLRNPKRR